MLRKPSTNELKERLVSETFNIEPIVENTHKNVLKKLACVLTLAAIFMGVEIAGGIISQSIAILSDAAHMLSDLLGFVISILSVYISGLPANKKHSYGYHRAGVIGALASVMVIWALTGFLVYFAIRRVINLNEVEVEGKLMFGVACFGLLTNLVMIKILHGSGHDHHGHDHGHDNHDHKHTHVHDKNEHKHDHQHSHGQELTHQNDTIVLPIETQGHSHKHECGSHSHSHSDDNEHHHDHAHDHDHHHAHDHDHSHIKLTQPLLGQDEHRGESAPKLTSNTTSNNAGEHHHHHHDHNHDHNHNHNHNHNHDHDHDHDHHHHHDKVAPKKNGHGHSHGFGHSHGHDHQDMNVRATIIHIFGDILQSIGVIIASAIIWINPDYKIADPIVTFIFAAIVLYTTIRIIKDCIFVLMEGTPAEFDMEEFEMKLKNVEGVLEIHDLHVWTLGVGKPAMSAHIFSDRNTGAVLKKVTRICRQYGIFHSTIQIETIQDKLHEDYFECKHNIH